MSLTYIAGDLFAAVKPGEGDNVSLIAHVCNNKGAWGAGFVIPLGMRYPKSAEQYHTLKPIDLKLGYTQLVEAAPGVYVANMIAQDGFPSRDRPVAVDYTALEEAMRQAVDGFLATGNKVTISAPLFGAGLGGGDWNTIESMIKTLWVDRGVTVNIYYIPGKTPPGWTPPKPE